MGRGDAAVVGCFNTYRTSNLNSSAHFQSHASVVIDKVTWESCMFIMFGFSELLVVLRQRFLQSCSTMNCHHRFDVETFFSKLSHLIKTS